MIEGKTVLAIIPARGGSKGVPRKNIRLVAGKPLIAWTIEEAKKSKYIDRLILSSDDAEIIAVAREWGCDVPFVRPTELSQDDTPGIEPVIHAITCLPDYDYVALLQPTSPLRTAEDIDKCLGLCVNSRSGFSVSVAEVDKSPYWMFTINPQGEMRRLLDTKETFSTRQELPKTYVLNGAVYCAACKSVVENRTFLGEGTIPYVMTKQASMDIDIEVDLVIAGILLEIAHSTTVGEVVECNVDE